MKNLILICLLLACSISYAQQYIPMPTANAVWKYRESSHYNGNQFGALDKLFYLTGTDTAITGHNYKKIMLRAKFWPNKSNGTNPSIPAISVVADSPDKYFAAIREDNKKVYIRKYNDTAEKLYYDFNLQIGDSMNHDYVDLACMVTNIDSVLIGTRYHKRYNDASVWYIKRALIEGVGPVWADMFEHSNGQNYMHLLCFTDAYGTYEADSGQCSYIFPYGTPLNTETVHTEVKTTVIYPNPVNDVLNISCAGDEERIMLSDVSGRIIYNEAVNTKQVVISTGDIPNGLYMLMIKCKEQTRYYKVVKE